jgi:hypothetical protein
VVHISLSGHSRRSHRQKCIKYNRYFGKIGGADEWWRGGRETVSVHWNYELQMLLQLYACNMIYITTSKNYVTHWRMSEVNFWWIRNYWQLALFQCSCGQLCFIVQFKLPGVRSGSNLGSIECYTTTVIILVTNGHSSKSKVYATPAGQHDHHNRTVQEKRPPQPHPTRSPQPHRAGEQGRHNRTVQENKVATTDGGN